MLSCSSYQNLILILPQYEKTWHEKIVQSKGAKKTEKSPILSKLKFGNLIVWFLSSKFEITRTTNKHTSFTSTLNPHEMETPNAYQLTFIATLWWSKF